MLNLAIFNDRSHHHTSNSRECMGVNGEALQLHAVHTKKPYFLLQVTRESVLQSNRLTVQTDENYRKSYLHTRVRTIALLKVWSDITTEALQKYAINTVMLHQRILTAKPFKVHHTATQYAAQRASMFMVLKSA